MTTIRKSLSSFGRRTLGAVGLALALLVNTAAAATPSSSMKQVDGRANQTIINLSYNVSGDGGSVAAVNLYALRNDGNWQPVATSFNPPADFAVNVDTIGGDGTYAFFTQAVLSTGEVEGLKNLAEVTVVVDRVAPSAPDANHLYINKSLADGTTNELTGHLAAVEAYGWVDVFSDVTLTRKVAGVGADATGSFGPVSVGMSQSVWVTVTDRNGNRSLPTKLSNQLSFSGQVDNLIAASYVGDMLDLSYDGVAAAVRYSIDYRHVGGAVWSAHVETESTTPKLTNLEAGRAYDIRVAPVDAHGNIGQYAYVSTRTAGTPVDNVILTNVAVGGDTLSPVVVATEVARPVAAAGVGGSTTSPVATTVAPAVDTGITADTTTSTGEGSTAATGNGEAATSAPATGETAAGEATPSEEVIAGEPTPTEESTPTEEAAPADQAADQGSSATPWVILAILIILAGIATGGYFYWFSGPEEVTTTVKPDEKSDEEDKRW